MKGMLSDVDGVLHANGKPMHHFEPIDGGWQYISNGPGDEFRSVCTIRPQDDHIKERWQHKADGEWVDIQNPFGEAE